MFRIPSFKEYFDLNLKDEFRSFLTETTETTFAREELFSMIRYTQWAFDQKNGVGTYHLAVVDDQRNIDTDLIFAPLMGSSQLTFQNYNSVTQFLTRLRESKMFDCFRPFRSFRFNEYSMILIG